MFNPFDDLPDEDGWAPHGPNGGEVGINPPAPPVALPGAGVVVAPEAPTIAPFSYQTPAYTGPSQPQYNFAPAPQFHAPRFQAPSAEDALNSPGYQFRLSQGEGALQSSAAARGVLRTGGTLQDILNYGQQAASQEYQNVFNRALQGYDRQYQAALGEFAPQYSSWQTLTGAQQHQADLAFQQAWDEYVLGIQDELAREEMLLNAGNA